MSEYGKKALKSAKEKVEVKRRLKKKYPQMYKEGWGKTKKKKNWAQRLKSRVKKTFNPGKSAGTQGAERVMRKNLSKKEIAKLGGK